MPRPIDELTQIVTAYQPMIQDIFGNLSDIRAKRGYKDALQEMAGFQNERDEYFRYKDIAARLANTPLSDEDLYNTQTGFDSNKLSLTAKSELESTNAWQDYIKYNDSVSKQNEINKEQGLTEQKPIGFQDFVLKNDAHKQEFTGLGFLKNFKTPKTSEEIYANKMKKSGLTPEDFSFYQEYSRKNFSPDRFNQEVVNQIYARQPNMISTGKLGSGLFDLYGRQMSQLMIQRPKVNTKIHNGYVINFDDYGNIVSKQKIDDDKNNSEDPIANSNPKDWQVEQAGDDYFYVADVFDKNKGWTVQRMRRLTNQEINDYKQGLADEESHRNKKTGKRSKGSGKGRMNPEQQYLLSAVKTLSKIGQSNKTKGGWDKWSKEDKQEYLDAAKYLEETTGLTGKALWDAVGYYEKTGKLDSRLFDIEEDDNEQIDDEEMTFDVALDLWKQADLLPEKDRVKAYTDTQRYIDSKLSDHESKMKNNQEYFRRIGHPNILNRK